MLKSHWRKCLAAAIVVASFALGAYYGREVISFVYGTLFGQAGAEPSRSAYSSANNSKILVFIHGVTGTPRETWTYQDNNTKTFWPDLVRTDERLKDYDIFLLSYYTPMVESGPSIEDLTLKRHVSDIEAIAEQWPTCASGASSPRCGRSRPGRPWAASRSRADRSPNMSRLRLPSLR
jgi:hypothetical protein